MAYGIWTTIRGGVTGTRATWLQLEGAVVRYQTLEQAYAEAMLRQRTTTLKGGYTPTGRPVAQQTFEPKVLR